MVLLNTCEMWSDGIKIAFFQKNCQAAGASAPNPHLWYVWVNYSACTRLRIYIFSCLTFGLRALPFENSSLKAKPGHGFWSYILRYLCPTKSSSFKNFWWRHCMSFLVWPSPRSKILATPMHGWGGGFVGRAPPNHCLCLPSESKILY